MLIKSKHNGWLADGTRTPFVSSGGGGGLLGGVTDLIFGSPPSPPPAPDYAGAAQQTAQGNLAAAQAATAANRVNQYTPYGNLTYQETGTDSKGNPIWSATQTLAPAQQQMLDIQNAAGVGLGQTINSALGRVQNTMGQGFNPNLPQMQSSAGQANLQTQTDYAGGMQGWDKANQLLMQRLQPQMEIQQRTLDAKLANQGVVPGTEAYNRAKMSLGMQQNDLLNQAQLSGLSAGNTLFQQGLQGAQFGNTAQQQLQQNRLQNAQLANQANQQAYTQALSNYNLPLNTLSALRTGSQVQNPTFTNVPQQATTSGADMLSAAQAGGQYNLGTYNAQQAANSAMTSGLMGLGGSLGAAAIMSDIRTKENIVKIGIAENGLPVYVYEYKPEWKDEAGHGKFVGHMAHEVEEIAPKAVITRNDGYKMVDYAQL
jgi:hypothetical protein